MEHSKKMKLINLVFAFILTLAIVGTATYFTQQYLSRKKADLESLIGLIKSEMIFADIRVIGMNKGISEFILTLYNLSQEKVLEKAFQLEGNDIFLQSKCVSIKSNDQMVTFVFPEKIYTEKIAPENGISLISNYFTNQYPSNYLGGQISAEQRKAIEVMSENLFFNKEWENNDNILVWDAALHAPRPNGYQIGKIYNFISHPNGAVELEEKH